MAEHSIRHRVGDGPLERWAIKECPEFEPDEPRRPGRTMTDRQIILGLRKTGMTCGQEALDEESGEKLGVRLTLPEYRLEDLLARYEVRARPDRQAGTYVVGIVPREGAEK